MTDEVVVVPVSKGGLIIKSLLMIVLGILMLVFTFASIVVGNAIFAVLLIFMGIALIASGSTFFGQIKRTWWVVVLGIIAVIIGIVALIWPVIGIEILVYIIAISSFISGVTDLYLGIMGKNGAVNRVLIIISGLLGIALGVVFLLMPLFSAGVIVQVAGIFLLAFGIVAFIEALMLKQ
ncbi:MAG: DUF308 domain-containing protein [Methanocorpusculum sp.]|nr:DUF308 domain-containing protein [Methanocorpusculum sp.]